MPRKSSIFMKILAVILPLVSVPIIGVGYFSIQASAERVNRLVRQEQQLLLEAAAERINRLLIQVRTDLDTLAGMPVLEDHYLARAFRLSAEEEFHRDSIRGIFKDFLARTPVYQRISCLDDQGVPLISLNRDPDAPPPAVGEYLDGFLRTVETGEEGLYLSALISSRRAGGQTAPGGGGFKMEGGKAFYSGWRQLAGVVMIDLDFDRIENIVQGIRVGEEGYAFMLDQKGRNIVHPTLAPYTLSPDNLPEPSLEPLTRAMAAGESGWMGYHFEGADKEAVFAPIPAAGWSLAVTVPIVELHRESLDLRSRVIQLVILTVLLSVTAVSVLSYHLLRPVRRLVTATQRIAEGDLEHEIPIGSRDELGELTTSFNHMVRTLARTQEELVRSAKLISLGRLSAGVAHEIRNPLNAMKAAVVHVKRRRADDPLIAEYTELISEEIDRLNRFVTDFLLFARQSPPRRIETNVNALIRSVVELFRAKAETGGVAVHLQLTNNPAWVFVDPGQIEQVLVNLVINALEALPDGGAVTVSSARLPADPASNRPGDLVVVTVQDTGPGIAREHLANIFDPFFTTKENGTGLGLPLSLGIVENHGGRLTVENLIGRGAAVRLELPADGGANPEVMA